MKLYFSSLFTFDIFNNILDGLREFLILPDLLCGAGNGIIDRGIMAVAELSADLFQRKPGQFPGDIHRNPTNKRDLSALFFGGEILRRNLVDPADLFFDDPLELVDRDLH